MSVFGGSRVRDRILVEFFVRPGTKAHVREVARRIGASAPAVGQELASLASGGILKTERVGRSLVYEVDERSPLVPELRGLVQKTLGVQAQLRDALMDLPGVDAAYIFGSHASGTESTLSDIDLLIVGEPNRVALSERLAPVERNVKRDVNVISKTAEEVAKLKTSRDPFWGRVLSDPTIQVAGAPRSL